eukprot:tig00021726_g23253.t1
MYGAPGGPGGGPPGYIKGKRPADGPPPRYDGGYGGPPYGGAPPPPNVPPPAYGPGYQNSQQQPPQKRARTGPPAAAGPEPTPSKVLHVRNLPANCTEQEIGQFIGQFGTVVTILVLRGKNQAFVEMTDVETARYVYDYHRNQRGSIRGQHVYFGFSERDSISIPAQHAKEAERPCRTLLVSVSNLKYPVTIDALYQVFQKFGYVQRIVQFTRAGEYHALIQFADINAATEAKSLAKIDGQNIYTGCCTLKISFASFAFVHVRYDSESQRDYARQGEPYGPPPGADPASFLAVTAASMPGVLSPDPQIQAAQIAAATQAVRHALNTMGGGAPPPPPPPHGGPHPPPPPHYHGHGPPPPPHHGHGYPPPPPPQPYYPPPHAPPPPYGPPPPGYGPPPPGPPGYHPGSGIAAPVTTGAGCVLLINNLPRNAGVNPDQISTLFGVYGDVMRVKILFSNPESALVQMANSQQADDREVARQHLDGVPVYGNRVKVSLSKHREVSLPKPGQPDYEHQHLTKDFSSSTLHRFKQPGSKNYSNICPPSAGLHVSNIATGATEEEIKGLFARHGRIVSFRFMKCVGSEKRMALLTMDSLSAAVVALIHTHNARIGDLNLRVSFSKSTPPEAQGRPPGGSGGGGGPGGPPPSQGYGGGGPSQGYGGGGPPPHEYRSPPPQAYSGGPPPQGYSSGGPPQGYSGGGPPQGYSSGGPQQGYSSGGPQQGYSGGSSQQGYSGGPPQQGYSGGPPQQGYSSSGPPRDSYGGGAPREQYGGGGRASHSGGGGRPSGPPSGGGGVGVVLAGSGKGPWLGATPGSSSSPPSASPAPAPPPAPAPAPVPPRDPYAERRRGRDEDEEREEREGRTTPVPQPGEFPDEYGSRQTPPHDGPGEGGYPDYSDEYTPS